MCGKRSLDARRVDGFSPAALPLHAGEQRYLILTCLRQPPILCRRNNFASATSVSLFPRERMRDITSDRFFVENTSAIPATD